MAAIKYFIGGLIGASIGAAIWAALYHYANFELGWIAWGIGFAAGVGVRIAADNEKSTGAGIVAVLCALLGLAGGKLAGAYLDTQTYLEDFSTEQDPEQAARSYLADEIVASWTEQDVELDWPRGTPPYEGMSEADYPDSIWQLAEGEWAGMPQGERDSFRDAYGDSEHSSEEFLISFLADDFAYEAQERNETLEWPRGAAPYVAWDRSDYPADVWTAMTETWDDMSQNERDSLIAEANVGLKLAVAVIAIDSFLYSFTLFDLLWFGLALTSAWYIAAHES